MTKVWREPLISELDINATASFTLDSPSGDTDSSGYGPGGNGGKGNGWENGKGHGGGCPCKHCRGS